MTNKEITHKLMENFSKDLYCSADDFLKTENSVILRKDDSKSFFSMLCFGYGAVACVDKSIFDWCKSFLAKHKGFRCFDGIQMIEISKQLEKHSYSIECGQDMLPDLTAKRNIIEANYKIKVYEKAEISSLSASELTSLVSISEKTEFVVAAYEKDEILGAADAKTRGENICEIGIEVLPNYRRAGIATLLTKHLTNELLNRDKIPYATAAWSNIASRGVLQRCNFIPASVKMISMDMEIAKKILIGDYV